MAPFTFEPFPLGGRLCSERPGAVKGAPLLGAAKRTLDSEDRSGMIAREGKASESSVKGGPAKMAPSPAALNIGVEGSFCTRAYSVIASLKASSSRIFSLQASPFRAD